MAETPSIDALLENATWLRALARSMLADRGLAEDALQETWVAALSEQPSAGSERPWLARVLRNFAQQRIRAESARSSRERRVARPEHLPAADEIVARAELHAKLVQAVLALDEPYRTTVLWRYFEGLSAEEIARRAKIEPATVRSRVARAREKLRASLMSSGGEPPERWLAALLPFGAGMVEVPTGMTAGVLAAVGVSAMKAKLIFGTVSIALLAVWLVSRSAHTPEPANPAGRALAVAEAAGVEEVGRAHDQDLPGTQGRLAVDAAPIANAAASSALLQWQGIVSSEDGHTPIEGARIAYRRGSEIAQYTPEEKQALTRDGVRSDAQGRFALEISANIDDGLWVEADGYFPFKLSAGDLPRTNATPIEIVLAPLGRIELEIVDETFKPYADMPVQYMIDVNRGSQDYMWSFRGWRHGGSTDAAGRVTLDKLPCGMPISFQRDDCIGRATFLGSAVHIDPNLRVLRHQVKLGRAATLTGRLEFLDGHPANGFALAWQSYPLDYGQPISARTGADGQFSISGVPAKPGELQFEYAGATPIRLTPQLGETKELGTIVVSMPLLLAARLTSRWFDAANMEHALNRVEVRAFRAGRALAGAGMGSSALRRTNNEVSVQLTDGPLEVVVSRGGFFFSGIAQPGEILARVQLTNPRTGLEISIDERTGALEVQLGERRPAKGEAVEVGLYRLEDGDLKPDPFRMSGVPDDAGHVRFAALPLGRFRCTLQLGQGDSASINEVTISAGQCASIHAPDFASFPMNGVVRNSRGEPIANASVHCRFHPDVTTATDATGRFRFDGLAAGIYYLEVSHGDFGTVKLSDVLLFSAGDPPIEIVLGGYGSLTGHVRAHGEAVTGLTVRAQPVDSNDNYNSITDDKGTFRLERLPGCRLRVWAENRFMEIHDLAAGEAREIEIELGESSLVSFTRNGEPVLDLDDVRALALDKERDARSEWHLAELRGASAELDLPEGRVLFDVTRARSGSNESLLALVNHPGATVELAHNSITIESATPWNGPLPRAMLLSIEGREVLSMWGGVIVLATERDDQGRVIVPCLPEKSRVRLSGFDSRGQRIERIVDVPAAASVSWP